MPIFYGTPEELQALQERIGMQQSGKRHALMGMFDDLDRDHLQLVHEIMEAVAENDNSKTAAFFDGVASHALLTRFQVCIACGHNHDEVMNMTVAPKGGEGEVTPPLTEDNSGTLHEATMKEYGVKLVNPGTDDTTVVCLGCGIMNPSLDDRMMKPPGIDGCGGCQRKGAWG